MRNRTILGALSVVTGTGMLLAAPSPAIAGSAPGGAATVAEAEESFYYYSHEEQAAVAFGYYYDGSDTLAASDEYSDGHSAVVVYRIGKRKVQRLWDHDGNNGQPATRTLNVTGNRLIKAKACIGEWDDDQPNQRRILDCSEPVVFYS